MLWPIVKTKGSIAY